MTTIAVLGGTGYAGRHIVAEAVRRGHTVLSVARTAPSERVEGATYVEGTLLDVPALASELTGADVVVSAVAPRGDMEGQVRGNLEALFSVLPDDVRVGVIGGAGGSLVAPGGPRVVDSGFPDEFKAEALEAIGVLEDLQAEQSGRDWFYIHPAGGFGAWNPGSAPVPTATAATSSSPTPTASRSSPAPTWPSPCSTRSRTRSTLGSASRSATDTAPFRPDSRSAQTRSRQSTASSSSGSTSIAPVTTGSAIVSVGGPMTVASSRR